MPSKSTTPRTCEACGKQFYPLRQHAGHFCSIQCYHHGAPPSPQYRDDGTVGIPLQPRGKAIRGYTIIDATDAEWALQWRWSMDSHGYAVRYESTGERMWRAVYLHRELLGLEFGDPMTGDHIDRDPLNNRRSNLRLATQAQQSHNRPSQRGTSMHRGVSRHSQTGRWVANVGRTYLGCFDTEEEAAAAALAGRQRLLTHAVD